MPATLKSVTSKVNDLDVDVDGDPKGITVQYTTRKLTPRVQKEIEESITAGDTSATIKQFLVLVSGWNFAPEPGKPPMPLTEEALADVPLEIIGSILDAITSDMSPKEVTET